MGTAKKTRKFGAVRHSPPMFYPTTSNSSQVKRILGQNDARLKKNAQKGEIEGKKAEKGSEIVREM